MIEMNRGVWGGAERGTKTSRAWVNDTGGVTGAARGNVVRWGLVPSQDAQLADTPFPPTRIEKTMLLKIVQAGEPVLRRVARPLTTDEIRSAGVKQLVVLMRETMRDAPGVGLAAPQIGEALQLAVIEDRAEYIDGMPEEMRLAQGRKPVAFHALFNPRLTVVDVAEAEFFEGCLSVGGFAALVRRATRVRVEALDENAQPLVIEADGWYARILQHEIDHLSGRLYVDRMDTRTFATGENHDRWWAGVPAAEIRAVLDGKRQG